MTTKNADLPANPVSVSDSTDGGVMSSFDWAGGSGLTKREQAAIAAMQGLLSSGRGHSSHLSDIAASSVKAADALFAELDKARG